MNQKFTENTAVPTFTVVDANPDSKTPPRPVYEATSDATTPPVPIPPTRTERFITRLIWFLGILAIILATSFYTAQLGKDQVRKEFEQLSELLYVPQPVQTEDGIRIPNAKLYQQTVNGESISYSYPGVALSQLWISLGITSKATEARFNQLQKDVEELAKICEK